MRKCRVSVYCQTPVSHCSMSGAFLGEHVPSTKVRCQHCNRWSVAERKSDGKGTKSGKGHDKGRLSPVQ